MKITFDIVDASTLRINFVDKATAIICKGLKTPNFLAVNTSELSQKHHLSDEEQAEILKAADEYKVAHPDYYIFIDPYVNLD